MAVLRIDHPDIEEFIRCKRNEDKLTRTLKSGPRKGEEQTQWKQGDECSLWEAIVSNFEKVGLTEDDAITRRAPGWFCGMNGSIAAHASSLNQNK